MDCKQFVPQYCFANFAEGESKYQHVAALQGCITIPPEHVKDYANEVFPMDWEFTKFRVLAELAQYCEYFVDNDENSYDWIDEITELYPDWLFGEFETIPQVIQMSMNVHEESPPEYSYLPNPNVIFKNDNVPYDRATFHPNAMVLEHQRGPISKEVFIKNCILLSRKNVSNPPIDIQESFGSSFHLLGEVSTQHFLGQPTEIISYPDQPHSYIRKQPQPKLSGKKLNRMVCQYSVTDYPFQSFVDMNRLVIGPFGTEISKHSYLQINWANTERVVTKKLLLEVFGRDILATHDLQIVRRHGAKRVTLKLPLLDMNKLNDVIYLVTSRKNITEFKVKKLIRAQCVEENKLKKADKENSTKSVRKNRLRNIKKQYSNK